MLSFPFGVVDSLDDELRALCGIADPAVRHVASDSSLPGGSGIIVKRGFGLPHYRVCSLGNSGETSIYSAIRLNRRAAHISADCPLVSRNLRKRNPDIPVGNRRHFFANQICDLS
jgi:hypothetical protein